ncbi:MAG TPA: hypothetical protein PKG48_06180 [Bacteroidales bacterium]|nr:hypothetical protein [Bacteroidales bacterium]
MVSPVITRHLRQFRHLVTSVTSVTWSPGHLRHLVTSVTSSPGFPFAGSQRFANFADSRCSS